MLTEEVVFIAQRHLGATGPLAHATMHTTTNCKSLTTSITRYDGYLAAPRYKKFRKSEVRADAHYCNRCPALRYDGTAV